MTVSIATRYGLFAEEAPESVNPLVEPVAEFYARQHKLPADEFSRLLVCRHVGQHDISPLQLAAKRLFAATELTRFSDFGPLPRVFGPRHVHQRWSLVLLPETPATMMPAALHDTALRDEFDQTLDNIVLRNRGRDSIAEMDRLFGYQLKGGLVEAMAWRLLARPSLHTAVESYHDTFLTAACTPQRLNEKRGEALKELRVYEAVFNYMGAQVVIDGAFTPIPADDPRRTRSMPTWVQEEMADELVSIS